MPALSLPAPRKGSRISVGDSLAFWDRHNFGGQSLSASLSRLMRDKRLGPEDEDGRDPNQAMG
jgi:hypothetical protein